MTAPIKFLSWVLGVAFTLGLGDSFVHLTKEMGKAAFHAQMYDQTSYARYNRQLWGQQLPPQKSTAARKSER